MAIWTRRSRRAVRGGLDPVRAIQLCTINTARYWNFRDRGAIAPGMRADLVVLEDLRAFRVLPDIPRGPIWSRRKMASPCSMHRQRIPTMLRHTMHIGAFGVARLGFPRTVARWTRWASYPARSSPSASVSRRPCIDGYVQADPARDILKLACIERHRATGNVGVGFVVGLGLREGAIASSVAHDAHNIIVAGTNDDDMARRGAGSGGDGRRPGARRRWRGARPVATADRRVALRSTRRRVAEALEHLSRQVQALGSPLPAPFATLSFLALSVIPAARVTDQGFVAL